MIPAHFELPIFRNTPSAQNLQSNIPHPLIFSIVDLFSYDQAYLIITI